MAVERGGRAMAARLRVAQRTSLDLSTTGPVLAQVWRGDGGRQARLGQFLKSVDVMAVDRRLGEAGGALLGRSRGRDAVDATLVAACHAGDRIVTGDPDDIRDLVAVSGLPILVVPC